MEAGVDLFPLKSLTQCFLRPPIRSGDFSSIPAHTFSFGLKKRNGGLHAYWLEDIDIQLSLELCL